MFVVIAYDVGDDKRRNKLHKTLKSYGEPVEESVFEADVEFAQLRRMQKRIEKIITSDDQVRYYILCEECRLKIEVLNGKPPTQTPRRMVI